MMEAVNRWLPVATLVLGILSFMRESVATVWSNPGKIEALASGASSALFEPQISWWAFNICFASATQVAWSLYVLYRSQELRIRSEQRNALERFFTSDLLYYAALPLLASPLGLAQVGQNAALEVINLYLGYTLYDLARALSPKARGRRRKQRVPLMAAVAVALGVLTVFGPASAEHMGLCAEAAARKYLGAFGSTLYVAGSGTALLLATWRAHRAKRATMMHLLAVASYSLGLWLRLGFCFQPAWWSTALGTGYFACMGGKFVTWRLARLARVTLLQPNDKSWSIVDLFSAWFERRALVPPMASGDPSGNDRG